MKFVVTISHAAELKRLNPEEVEIVVNSRELSRSSTLDLKESIELIKESKDLGFNVYFDFDILSTEDSFSKAMENFKRLPLHLLSAIRVQDLGFAYEVFQHTKCGLHLITETGNHNLKGLLTYEDYFGDRLQRLVVSQELNWEKLKTYRESLKTPIEILGFGRILIFYTPRKLVSHQDRFDWIEEQVEVRATSEESPHKDFPVIENRHGTFMYHLKELFLLDRLDLIEASNVDFLRIDIRHRKDIDAAGFLKDFSSLKNFPKDLKSTYAPKSIRGYFQTNKSDVLFKRLKNHRTQRKDLNYIGEVIDASKGQYLALNLKGGQEISSGDLIEIFNPDGKTKVVTVDKLKDTKGEKVSNCSKGLVLTDYIGGVWVKAQIYKADIQKSAQDYPAH